jgi:tetratricopeptide (TPR) repeat protein
MTTNSVPYSENSPLTDLCSVTLENFKQVTKQYALFHICFFSLAFLELVAFVLFFSFFTQTTLFAFSLATLFLTGFTYFVLLFYFQAKKPQQLQDIHSFFLHHCKDKNVVNALENLLLTLHRQEYAYYALPHSFHTLAPLMQKFSAWIHWKDIYKMKELILMTLIKEQVDLVKLHPTDLKTHANLGNTYLALSELYTDPRKLDSKDPHPWISPDYETQSVLKKRDKALHKALEEYKILSFYAPYEPWVYDQLAQIHCLLNQTQEAIHSYEIVLAKISEDRNILFRLGILYFENGDHARALRLYEQLKSMQDPLAEELITYYE